MQVVNGLLAAAISATDDMLGKCASYLQQPKPAAPNAPPMQPTHDGGPSGSNANKMSYSHAETSADAAHPIFAQLQHARQPSIGPEVPFSSEHTVTAQQQYPLASSDPHLDVRKPPPNSHRIPESSESVTEPVSRSIEARNEHNSQQLLVAKHESTRKDAVGATTTATIAEHKFPQQKFPASTTTMTFSAQQLAGDGDREMTSSTRIRHHRSLFATHQRLLPSRAVQRPHSARRHHQQQVGSKRLRHPDDSALRMHAVIQLPTGLLAPIEHALTSTARESLETPAEQIPSQPSASPAHSMPTTTGSDQNGADGAVAEGYARCGNCIPPYSACSGYCKSD